MAEQPVTARKRVLKGQNRIRLLGLSYVAFFAIIGAQLVRLTALEPEEGEIGRAHV